MAKYLYRVSLIHVEPTQAKSRKRNIGTISQLETNNKREARAEIERLQEMTAQPSWQIPCELLAERSEISDFVAVDIDTLEPVSSNVASDEAAPAFPDLAKQQMSNEELSS